MLEVLADRTYRRLFAAQVIALAGTGLLTVALALLAYDLAGERAGAGVRSVPEGRPGPRDRDPLAVDPQAGRDREEGGGQQRIG